jgi:GNAT superfamily N-acetyltransferase
MADETLISAAEARLDETAMAAYVDGVHAAGNPYFDYLFGDAETARSVLSAWVRRPSSEVACGRARVLLKDGFLAGGHVLLSAEEWRRCRSADLFALLGLRNILPRAVAQQRLKAAQGVFMAVEATDHYLSKFWVDARFRGAGVAAALLPDVMERARRWGAQRVVLDVHAANERAIGVYQRAGFEILSRQGSASGLEYLSMGRRLHP